MKEVIVRANKNDAKYFHFQTKIADASKRIIKGFASTRFPDRDNDVVEPAALAASMALYMQNPVILMDHDQCCPIGKCRDYQITQDGLFVTVEIMSGTGCADDCWAQIEFGARNAFSIGFIPKEVDWTSQENPVIRALELLEISVVCIPANRESLFSIAKALKMGTDLRDREVTKLGWAKTKAKLIEAKLVIDAEFDHLPTEEKIWVESMLKSLQNRTQVRDAELKLTEDIERAKLQFDIEMSRSVLRSLM